MRHEVDRKWYSVRYCMMYMIGATWHHFFIIQIFHELNCKFNYFSELLKVKAIVWKCISLDWNGNKVEGNWDKPAACWNEWTVLRFYYLWHIQFKPFLYEKFPLMKKNEREQNNWMIFKIISWKVHNLNRSLIKRNRYIPICDFFVIENEKCVHLQRHLCFLLFGIIFIQKSEKIKISSLCNHSCSPMALETLVNVSDSLP